MTSSIEIGIVSARDADYHPNHRLMEAGRCRGHGVTLLDPYRLWPCLRNGRHGLVGESGPVDPPRVVLPRQGAEIGASSRSLVRHLERMGVVLVNGYSAIDLARDKFASLQVLAAAGLPVPDTVLVNEAAGVPAAAGCLGGYPLVGKVTGGRQGRGVERVAAAEPLYRMLARRDLPGDGLLVQVYFPPAGRRDIRVLVIGGRAVAAVVLSPEPGDFRANFHLTGRARALSLTEPLAAMAVAAAAALDLDVAGVDLMVDDSGRTWVNEVNYAPGFKGMEMATGLDVAGRIIEHAVEKCGGGRRLPLRKGQCV